MDLAVTKYGTRKGHRKMRARHAKVVILETE